MVIEPIVKGLGTVVIEAIKKYFWPLIKTLVINLILENIKELFGYVDLKIKKFISKMKEEKSESIKYAEEKRKDAQKRAKYFDKAIRRSKKLYMVNEDDRRKIEAETEARVWKEVEDRLKIDLKNFNAETSELIKDVKVNEKESISNVKETMKELNFDDIIAIDGANIKLIDIPKAKAKIKKSDTEKTVKKTK